MMIDEKDIFQRSELLLGAEAMSNIAQKRVIVFGVGGVGSWCAESLVRSGIRHLTIVDSDSVCASNINRQLMATTETAERFHLETYDYIIDAIDSLKDKALLILMATTPPPTGGDGGGAKALLFYGGRVEA